ncbi:MAG: hypothetical protein G01um10145_837 [Microgenomates group bacterium Gr01-1014_5]|nr:MAG: hypothetical protein G01um10145_837 [Microgenomates group bacterium Gr01-1014_5]
MFSTNFEASTLLDLVRQQDLGSAWLHPIGYAIRNALTQGVPIDNIVLLLLLPLVAAVIAASRHLIGLRGFGIFLPAALSAVFVATGPVVGIGLFLVIVSVSTFSRMLLRRLRVKLQYLPRMALILLVVVLAVLAILFVGPQFFGRRELAEVSIFPVLILVLLAEDFTRAQLGKSIRIAASLTVETLILALFSFVFLSLSALQEFALLNPEIYLLIVLGLDLFLGTYSGLRLLEIWRFRKLIRN